MKRAWIVAIVPALALCAGFEDIARSAAEARRLNRVPEAIRLYRQAVAMRPVWDEGWWALGSLLYDAKRHVEARDALRRYVELKPEAGAGWALLGLSEYSSADNAAAAAHLARAVDVGVPNEHLARLARLRAGTLLTKFERFDLALKLLTKIEGKVTPEILRAAGLAALRLPILPSDIRPDQRQMIELAGRGAMAFAAGNTAAARAALQTLVLAYPAQPNVHYLFGTLLASVEPDAALAQYRREIEISPTHVPALVALTHELIRLGKPAEAVPHARVAAANAPKDFQARYAYGRALLATGRAGQAAAELEAAAKIRPESPDTHYALARCYYILGFKEQAERAHATYRRLTQQASRVPR